MPRAEFKYYRLGKPALRIVQYIWRSLRKIRGFLLAAEGQCMGVGENSRPGGQLNCAVHQEFAEEKLCYLVAI